MKKLLIFLLFSGCLFAQNNKPTNEQKLEIRVKLREAQIANIQAQEAQRNLQTAVNAYNTAIVKVRNSLELDSTWEYDDNLELFKQKPQSKPQPKSKGEEKPNAN